MIVSAINICHLIMNPFHGDRQPGGRPDGAGHAALVAHANGKGGGGGTDIPELWAGFVVSKMRRSR